MKHYASAAFWKSFDALPPEIQSLARKNFDLLRNDPRHPSLRFKKAGKYWSAGVGLAHRAVALEIEDN